MNTPGIPRLTFVVDAVDDLLDRLRAHGAELVGEPGRDGRTDALLREAVGSNAEWLRDLANGIDDRPVVPDRSAKSSGTENTFSEDLHDIARMRERCAMRRGT